MERGYAATLAVPLWARFMTAATRGDGPEAFPIPSSVRPVAICRISGKLATDRCRDAATFTAAGLLEQYSAVETEYFVAGTEPTGYCHEHDAPIYQEVVFDQEAPLDAPPMRVPITVGTTGRDPDPTPPPPMPATIPPAPMPAAPMPPVTRPTPIAPSAPVPAPPPEQGLPNQPGPPIEEIIPPPPAPPPGG